uniref:C-type lectin domain-containing protein n=1 Tax=Amphiprion percula TaxID=161767 RepID=A0A3P8TTP2_AMPPE
MTPVIRLTASSAPGRNVSRHSGVYSFCSKTINSKQALLINVSPFFFTSASSLNPPAPTKNPCPSGYTSWYQNCYKVVETPATWDDAEAACQQEGGNLASIDMSYDQAFVAGVVLQGKADVWIGLRRQEDGSYKWTDGWPIFFTHWGPGEPSNIKDEGCVSMHAALAFHGTWNDTKCDLTKPYICKISSGITH